MKTMENETFRLKGKPIVKIFESRLNKESYLFQLQTSELNKDEVVELIDWLIKKIDEIKL